MGKILPFTGNSHNTPEHNRLSAAEAPIIAQEIYAGDSEDVEIADIITRMEMSRAAVRAVQQGEAAAA